MDIGIVGLIIILITIIVSYKGLKDDHFFTTYAFNTSHILVQKDYKGLVTSGFLHGSWKHLLFNMFSLYSFSSLEYAVGPVDFLLLYMTSLIGGNLLSLYMNRLNSQYTAVGASGAVCGIIFASVAYDPGIELGLIMVPGVSIPGWLFGLIYVVITIYGIGAKNDNVGHEAHLGGAITGELLLIGLYPEKMFNNTLPILLTLVPALIFLFLVHRRPAYVVTGSFVHRNFGETKDDLYNRQKRQRQAELDSILEKIHTSGFDSLTIKEKNRLDKLSR
ncbi:rhomboid family intramembrane serine protease [Parachryseolinea silvisoli]|uniref:rhomboid family intramembrane serine protease n=1 Tax=Parachryseolinea silvisoli TaxID=2873601 RepID=UPI002265B703|nr:rhomboid family intramembrane serine protease [Parachryseolinea silvisoli]MCD9019233.1 rhomboid family intramembrane serine protease [Parachryseolinea silvisoli]